MLNLIIAIISDTYANIQSVKKASAMKSQIKLMVDSLEAMNVFFNMAKSIFNLKENKIYINFCRYPDKFIDKGEKNYEG